MVMVIRALPSSRTIFLANEMTRKSLMLLLDGVSQGGDGRTELEVEQQSSMK